MFGVTGVLLIDYSKSPIKVILIKVGFMILCLVGSAILPPQETRLVFYSLFFIKL